MYRLLPSLIEAEMETLARWRDERLFDRTLAASEGKPAFVFYEGPPTANGRPGIHHVFARTIKDLFCRHRAMQGYHVPRKAGWDTHGLPVEIEVEKKLGLKGKPDIETFGVAEFNRLSRESVWQYRAEWEKLSERFGYWLDYEHPYVTYSNEYIESEWWALAELYRRGLLYQGFKVLPYCPRCETALSSHEVALGYEDETDPSVYVALKLRDQTAGVVRRILVWTTTPWTLVSNVALAVKPDLDYVEMQKGNETLILAAARVDAVLGEGWTEVARLKGADLVGLRYTRPLDWVAYPAEGKHEIIVGEDFVTAEDGSGVVHMAPAFGADDFGAMQRHGLAFMQPVNSHGEFDATVPVVGGLGVRLANDKIIASLREHRTLFRAEQFTHSYPHCWRCQTPLLYYARTSYFVRTTAVRDAMLQRNALMDWHPSEVGTGRFGEWLAGNIDWSISRDRYWGTPLPLWVCESDRAHVEAIGSYAELADRVGQQLGDGFDPHKPEIDRYTWTCRHCGGTMRRVNEVIDAWFDSGSMPFAQWHYPFEHRHVVKRQFPADFIAEGVDQTRGWFYSMLAIATALGPALPNNGDDRAAPYRSVVVNDLVLDANGQKMSKSRGNAVDPWGVIERHGADALRLFLVSSAQVWLPRKFDESAIRDGAGRFLITLANSYKFFAELASHDWTAATADTSHHVLDRWLQSRLARVERAADEYFTRFEATDAARVVMDFVENDLSRWYIRLSRQRFWAEDPAAFATLHEALVVSCRLLAPVMPFVTDWIHRELTGSSVHLSSFVRQHPGHVDEDLERAMDDVRELVGVGRTARETAGLRVRQALSRVVCVLPTSRPRAAVEALAALLASELNVKRVEFLDAADSLVTLSAKANFRTLGKKFGKGTPLAADAVAALTSAELAAFQRGEAPLHVTVDGQTRSLDTEDLVITHGTRGDLVVEERGGYVAAIDPAVTPELEQEGLAREVIRQVQILRKESGLAVSDRIRLAVWGDPVVEEAVRAHRDRIAGEVLARELKTGSKSGEFDAERVVQLDGRTVHLALTQEVER
jgi:isoleucyl-tRNA synthetase